MTSVTMTTASVSASFTTTTIDGPTESQEQAPLTSGGTTIAPPALLTQNSQTDTDTPQIDDPKSSTDPEDMSIALQQWAADFAAVIDKSAESRLKTARAEISVNLADSLKKLQESIEKMRKARERARKARILGFLGKVFAVVVSAVVAVAAGMAAVGSGGIAAGPAVLAAMAAISAVTSMIDLGGAIDGEVRGGDGFSIAKGMKSEGWAGVISLDLSRATVGFAEWCAKLDGKTLSPEAKAAIGAGAAFAQLALTLGATYKVAEAAKAATAVAGAANTTAAVLGTAGKSASVISGAGSVVGGSLAISQGAFTIESAEIQRAADYRRADALRKEEDIKRTEKYIEEYMNYSKVMNEVLQASTAVVAKCIEEWSSSMSNLGKGSREKNLRMA